ncbi:hypothetical protein O181_058860 [Austropuccinia psidii MF-1]|uniref:Uncharacterized protein n=1 Tax=Austropuccinia psidii MF-1 TaxID=1389203 RepID=A0A9Q3HY90_9BASI|nr:hypothetical protein [Austropuccinia psidii MF-1]
MQPRNDHVSAGTSDEGHLGSKLAMSLERRSVKLPLKQSPGRAFQPHQRSSFWVGYTKGAARTRKLGESPSEACESGTRGSLVLKKP